jgi:hypothetical protein
MSDENRLNNSIEKPKFNFWNIAKWGGIIVAVVVVILVIVNISQFASPLYNAVSKVFGLAASIISWAADHPYAVLGIIGGILLLGAVVTGKARSWYENITGKVKVVSENKVKLDAFNAMDKATQELMVAKVNVELNESGSPSEQGAAETVYNEAKAAANISQEAEDDAYESTFADGVRSS